MMTHTIRLRSPWRLRELAGEGQLQNENGRCDARAAVPGDWGQLLGADYSGRAEYRRVFHCPTGLAIGEAVFLLVDQVRSRGEVFLNTELLGEAGAASVEFDITDRLAEPNELIIEVEHPVAGVGSHEDHLPGGLVGEVRLEIRPRG